MFSRKTKRMFAMICVAIMLFTSLGENAMVVMATEGSQQVLQEEFDETSSVEFVEATQEESDTEEIVEADETSSFVEIADEKIYKAGEKYHITDDCLIIHADVESINYGDILEDDLEIFSSVKVENDNNLKLIGGTAFAGAKILTSVDLTNCYNLTDIGGNAFSGCTSLCYFDYSNSLQTIGASAFMNTALEEVVLKENITQIENYAFKGCSNLTTVNIITKNVSCAKSIGIFEGCNLKNINFTSEHTVIPAGLFKKATFFGNSDEDPTNNTTVTIPYYIQEIGASAFAESNVIDVIIEDSEENHSRLSSISESAFYSCKTLNNMVFPASLKMIGKSAFSECLNITEVSLPNTVSSLGNNAFSGCAGLTVLNLSNGLTTIGDGVFSKCISLSSVVIPAGIEAIGSSMFADCMVLEEVTIALTVKRINDYAFKNCIALEHIVVPDSVTYMGIGVFQSTGLINPVLSKNIDTIPNYTFMYCVALKTISFSDVLIGDTECLVIPDNIEQIGASAFSGCSAIKNLTIGENVVSIGTTAFSNCTAIKIFNLESLVLNNCGSGIFYACYLETVIFPDGIETIPANLFNKAHFTADRTITIPNTVKVIGKNAFAGDSTYANNISNIVFEENSQLLTISDYAFSQCTYLTEFDIPDTTTTIGNNAFEGCIKISEITIPEYVTQLGASAFSGCSILTTINYNAISVLTSNRNIFKDCNIHTIIIGEKVTILPGYLLFGAKFSTKQNSDELVKIAITFPESLIAIGDYALNNITNLSEVIFLGNRLERIGASAFESCIGLERIELPTSVTYIGNSAFKNCTLLTGIELPEALEYLGSHAFYGTGNITSCNIPAGVPKILSNTFYSNISLEEVTFEEGALTDIESFAFYNCDSLTSVKIPQGTISIGASAFADCNALTKVRIPDSVTSIADMAFANCDGITFYVVKGSYAETWAENNGYDYEYLISIHYVLDGGVNDPRNIGGYEEGEKFTFYPAKRTGCTFEGWYLDENFRDRIYNLDNCTGELTLYAKWSVDDYVITYELDGGTNHPANPLTYSVDDTITFDKPTKRGYYFNGWYSDKEYKTKITQLPVGSSGNLTIYAKWTAISYSIRFFANAGVGNIDTITLTGDEEFTIPADGVTRAGYTLVGWNTTYNGTGTSYELGQVVGGIGEPTSTAITISLYAQWIPNKYTISFDANGGLPVEEIREIDFGTAYGELPSTSRLGYTFMGWYTDVESGKYIGKESSNVKHETPEDITLYARWTANQYTVNLNANGGSFSNMTSSHKISADAPFNIPNSSKVIRQGYTLVGWNTKADGSGDSYACGTDIVPAKILNQAGATLTLFAQWEQGVYEIIFETLGGTVDTNTYYVRYGEKYGQLPIPVRTGYKFDGWYSDQNYTVASKIAETTLFKGYESPALYAKWTAINYTVLLEMNYSGAKPVEIAVQGGAEIDLNDYTVMRKGYSFVCWNSLPDGTGESYVVNQVIVPAELAGEETTIVLYAQWMSDLTAQAPTASHESGSELFKGTKIFLSTTTPGAHIYYTTNGDMPTIYSTLYSDAIVLEEAVTIKAITVMEGYNNSPVAEFTYTLVDESQYWGDIIQEDRALFTDATHVPNGIWVAGVKDATFTGKAITFDLRVYDYKTLLKEKTDYSIKYANNKIAATKDAKKAPSVTITAKGNYKGKLTVTFNINPLSIESEEFVAETMYAVVNNKVQKPVPVMTYGKTKLANKKDYTVSYPTGYENGFVAEGEYKITLTGKGNYSGTKEVSFVLKNKKLISKASVKYTKSVTYDGTALKPSVTVKDGKTTLVAGTDYSVDYLNNIEVGTGTIIISGMNNYIGVKKVQFTIKPIATMNKTTITLDRTSVKYTGNEITVNNADSIIKAAATYDGKMMHNGTDYVIDGYTKNIDVGTATVIFTGKGKYAGSVKKTFKILPAELSDTTINFMDAEGNVITDEEASYEYMKGGVKPAISLTYNGKTYVSGKDFTVSYKNNTKVGNATVTIKGKKNFKGTITKAFKIESKDLNKVEIAVQDVAYKNAAKAYIVKPVLKDTDGKALKAGKDYNSVFEYTYAMKCEVTDKNGNKIEREYGDVVNNNDIIPFGTAINVKITGIGCYTGAISQEYRIVKTSIAKAKVKVQNQYYTGTAVEPGKADIEVKVGSTILNSSDYEIVGYSNNVKKGTATVTLKGIGNYGGTITVKYKIVEKSFILKLLGL